jgi:hypothetical protein
MVVSSCNLVKHPFFPSDVGWHGNKQSVIVQWSPRSSMCSTMYLIGSGGRHVRGHFPLDALFEKSRHPARSFEANFLAAARSWNTNVVGGLLQ